MDEEDVVEVLLEHARANDAHDVAVLDVPPEMLEEFGSEYVETRDAHGRKLASTLVAGALAREDDEVVVLDSPSRVGRREDFSPQVRQRLRAEGVFGFRDDNLDGVEFPKNDVTVYRP